MSYSNRDIVLDTNSQHNIRKKIKSLISEQRVQ